MTLRLPVHNRNIEIPEDVNIPEGTIVVIEVPEQAAKPDAISKRIPTFRGNGLLPGVDLEDKDTVWQILDADKPSQLL